jgi:hypothetical protein
MQFPMADGTRRELSDVISAEVEHGRLVCRDRWGLVRASFARGEVVAWGETPDR